MNLSDEVAKEFVESGVYMRSIMAELEVKSPKEALLKVKELIGKGDEEKIDRERRRCK